jgi:hypothetical protein
VRLAGGRQFRRQAPDHRDARHGHPRAENAVATSVETAPKMFYPGERERGVQAVMLTMAAAMVALSSRSVRFAA